MKKLTILLLALSLLAGQAMAHDHLEVGLTSATPKKLEISGELAPVATYFPLGEYPSGFLTYLPGGAFYSEITISAFDDTPPPPNGALVYFQVLLVTGPEGGTFSFWDEQTPDTPVFALPSGWSSGPGQPAPQVIVSEDTSGYGHIHGRAFAMDVPGEYVVVLEAIDLKSNSPFPPSEPVEIHFTAQPPPPLSISAAGTQAQVSLTGRADFTYDLQSSTTLDWDDWETIFTEDGDGGLLTFTDPKENRPAVYYRIVEY